jgi:hypothetical protein
MAYGTINADLMTTSDGVSSSGLYGFKNRILNGQMAIDQRNAGASVTLGTADTYTLDRWQFGTSVASKYSCQQNAGSITPPAGFGNYLGITSLSAYTVGSAETFNLIQRIEGFNTSDLAWGTANAKTVTLSAWVYSSLTGTFGGAITNSAFTYSYPFSYTISSANTWTQISITIAGPTAGTWVGATNGAGLVLRFSMGTGSTLSGTAGAWTASGLISATGAVSVVGTNGATFYITGVQLEKGSTATSFDYRPYSAELAMCQRYYEKSYNIGTAPGTSSVTGLFFFIATGTGDIQGQSFAVPKRATPTVTLYDSSGTSGRLDNSANAMTANYIGEKQFGVINGSGLTKGNSYLGFFVASIEL